MDVHGSGMHRLLRGPPGPGVLDFLRGEAAIEAILHPTQTPGLSLVPVGSHAEHAEGLFLRPKLDDLLAELRRNHDFVILDGAPVLAADDAALLVPHADVVVMVVRPFYTRSRLVRQALDMLYQRQAKQVAIILNRARAEDLAGHYAQNGISRISRNGVKAHA
jgi:tyrosine-protein kinase Etk/Wzc